VLKWHDGLAETEHIFKYSTIKAFGELTAWAHPWNKITSLKKGLTRRQEEGAHSTRSRWIDACEFHDKSNFISYNSPGVR
jgi:hypothetical protein